MAVLAEAQDVLRLHVQVQYVGLVHEVEALADLHHVELAVALGENEVLVDDSFEELTTHDA